MKNFPPGTHLPTLTQVLNNPAQYSAFISILQQPYPIGLHTGIFSFYNHFFKERSRLEYPEDWDKSHSGMSLDDGLGENGRLAVALSYKESHSWFMKLNNKTD